MAKLNFPGSPTVGTLYTDNGNVWRWNGSSWVSYNSLDLTSQVSGALGTTFGGTGFSSYTVGDILYASTANSLGKLPSGNINYVLTSNGPSAAPSWQAVPPSAASSVAVSSTNLNQSFFITAVNTDNGSGLGLSTVSSFVINPFSGLMTLPGIALTNGVNSTSSSTGSLYVQGGVGIGLSLSVGGRLQLFNGANYTSFVSSASGNTTYTLPATSPATGSSVLSATASGVMSWVPLVASGGVNVASSSGGTVLYIAGINDDVASGLAVSSNPNLTYNTSTNTLNSSYYSGTWAGSTITTLYGGTGLSAFTKGDLLVGLGDTLYKLPVGTQGQLLQAFSSATSGLAWTSITPPTYGAFYSTQTQTVTGSGVSTPVTLNSTFEAYNAQIYGGSGTSSRIQIQTSGTYNVQFSAQLHLTQGTQPKKGDFWFRINGVDVPQSNTEQTINGKDNQTVLALNFISYFAANDYFEIIMSSDDQYFSVEALSGLTGPPRPDIPSMIVTVVPVTQIVGSSAGLGVSGIVSVNGLNQYIQYFATGRSGTDFNISSSSQTHTFNIPHAGIGATGLITSQTQTIGGNKTFVNDLIVSSTTVSNSTTSGALVVTGGVGIGGSLNVASATAISGVTINNGVITGNLTGFATTATNINVVSANASTPHYILFSPNATGSGVALSSLSSLTINPVTNIFSIGTGTFAANGISVGSASNTITTSSGQLNLDSVGGQTNLNDNVVISGNLTVQGTTITVDSTISTLVDPVIVLGSGVGGTHSTLDNNQDRGIEFRWSNAGTATTGFFGFSDTDGKFRFIPNASIPSANVYTGTAGTAVFATIEATLSGNASGTAATYTNFYGSLTGTATTGANIHLASTGTANGPFYLTMSSSASGAGVALSSDTSLQYNSSTDVLTVTNISGSAITASTSFSGQLFGNVTGTATTSTNVHLSSATTNSAHRLIFSPSSSGSGVALSTSAQVSYNPSTFVLSSSGVAVTANTNSSASNTGALTVIGGVGIGQSLSVDGRIQFFNGANYTAFVSSATGNTVYILPATSPATGNSVLQSTSTGVMSWVPLVASASGTTAQNIVVNSAGAADVFHPVLFTPSQITSGSAVSSDPLITYNASSDRLFVSGIFVTSGTASTSTFTGGLLVAGGLGVSGQVSFTRASLGFTGVTGTPTMSFIGATSSPYISLNVLSDNSLSFEGSSGQLFTIDNNLSIGEIFAVSDISGLPIISASAGQTVFLNEFGGITKIGDGTVNASSTTNAAFTVFGGFGLTGNAFIGGTASITNSTVSISTASGALVVTGGVGIGGSVYTSASNANSISGVVLSNGIVRTGSWAATAITSFYGGTGHSSYTNGDLLVGLGNTIAKLAASANTGYVLTSTGAGSVPTWQAVPPSAASSVAVTTSTLDQSFFVTFVNTSSGSGLGLTTATSFVVNPSSGLVSASGLALTNLSNSTSTTSGALRVSGGLGVTGNAFIGGTINAPSVNQSNISNVYFANGNVTGTSVTATTIQGTLVGTATTGTNIHLASTGSAAGPFYLVVSSSSAGSGVALSSDSSLSYNSSTDVLTVPNISGSAITASTSFSGQLFGNVTGTATTATYANESGYGITAGIATTARNINVANANTNTPHTIYFGPSATGSGIAVSSNPTISFNPSSFILSTSGLAVTATTASTNSTSGALVVTGGVGIGDSLFVAGNISVNSGTNGLLLRKLVSGNYGAIYSTNVTPSSTNYTMITDGASVNFNGTNGVYFNINNTNKIQVTTSNINIVPTTESTSASTGAFTVAGGVGIGGSLYVASATGISGVSINNGVVIGNLTGTATTSRNTFVNAATTSSDHYLIFSPNASGSGVALSSGANLVFNPSLNILSIGTGTFAANGISVGAALNTITTASGNLNLDSVSGQTNINDNVVIQGNLTVQGTTITVDSTVSTFVDPVVVLGSGVGGTHSTLDNNQDRGIEFRWSNSGTATTGFFGFTDGDGKFRFIPNASISSSNVYAGTAGTAVFGTVEATLSGNSSGTASTYTNFYGSLIGTATTSTNVHLASTGNAVGPFYLAMSASTSGAGVALSSDSNLQYNSATDVLTVSNISGSAITASTSFSGQLFGNVTGTATTATYSHQSGYGITAGTAITASNVYLAVGANAVNHSVIFSPSATGSGVALSTDTSLLYNPNTDTLTSTNFAGNLSGNVTGTATTSANVHLASTGNVAGPFYLTMSSATSGAGLALSSDSSLSYNSATDVLTVSNISGSAITASTSFAGPLFGNVTGFATTARNIDVSNATSNAAHPMFFGPIATGSGVAISSNTTLSYNPSSFILSTSGLAVTSTTVSTNSTSGALVVSGGVGIGGSVFIDGNVKINFTNHTAFNVADIFTVYGVNNFEGANIKSNYSYAFNVQDKSNNNRFTIDVGNNKTILSGNSFSHELRIYNANQVGYTGFVAASTGTVTYTLPAGDGSANFLLTTNGSGVLSWANISGLAVTNINGLTSSYQYLAFDYSGSFPSWSSSGATHTLRIPLAGTASTGLVSNLAQSFAGIKTFTNDVFISSATASTWAANGALRIQGGLGVSGQLSFNQAALGYTGASNPSIAFIGGTTSSPITLTVLSDNSLIFEGNSGKLFGINNNLSSGWIFNVGDISGIPLLRANADGNVAMAEFAGNVGVGLSNPAYKLHVTGSVGFTASTGSTNTTTGALIVTGGVGIGQSVSVGGRLQLFNGANHTAFVSSATGNTVYTLPATSPATGSSVLSSTSTGVMSWVPLVAGSSSGTVNSGTATYAAFYASSTTAVSENANIQFTGSGVSVGGNINSTSTRSGSLYVSGGLGVTGNAFIGGTVNITNTTAATGVSTAALVVSGGLGVNGDVYVANAAGSKLSIMQSSGDEGGEIFLNKPVTNTTITNGVTVDIYQNRLRFFESGGSNRGFYLDIVSGGNGVGTNIMGGASSGTVNSGTATFAAFYAGTSNAVSENANLQFTGTGLSVGGNINSTSTRSGSLYVSGGLGVTGNAFIGGTTIIQNTTAATSTNSGALVVAGGVGIGGSLYVGDAIRVGTDTYSKVFERGDILLDNGTNDSPGTKYYWQNNKNFGTDVYSPGTGITKYRIVKELGESGGQELVTIDREATLYLHNHTNTSLYAGFRFSGSGSTVYTLPSASPAIGTSYLVSNSSGVMSWIRPKRSYVLSFGAGFTPTANSADTVQINIPYAPDNVALNYIVKRVEYRNETVAGGTGLSFYIERHTGGDALWSTAHRIHAGSGASFEVGALVNQISFTTINSSAGTNGLVASGDYIRLYFTTVGSAANVSISLTIEEQ